MTREDDLVAAKTTGADTAAERETTEENTARKDWGEGQQGGDYEKMSSRSRPRRAMGQGNGTEGRRPSVACSGGFINWSTPQ